MAELKADIRQLRDIMKDTFDAGYNDATTDDVDEDRCNDGNPTDGDNGNPYDDGNDFGPPDYEDDESVDNGEHNNDAGCNDNGVHEDANYDDGTSDDDELGSNNGNP